MIKHFLNLEIKSFFRSASVGKSLGLKILMGFLGIYFTLVFLAMGVGMYPILEKLFPKQEPVKVFNNLMVYWILFEMVFRFFMQTLPVINIRSFLLTPIKKQAIIHYVLIKSMFSFYNLMAFLIAVPFVIFCRVQGDITNLQLLVWLLLLTAVVFSINFANFLIKKKFTTNIKGFLPFVGGVLTLVGLEYFNVFKTSFYAGQFFNFSINNPLPVLGMIALAVGLYAFNFSYLRKNFYLDASLKQKVTEAETTNLDWTRRFGEIAPFLQLDLKLIWRNKRPKATIWMALIFLAYGLMFYTNPQYSAHSPFFVFVGIFMTGIFMISFGQFIPAWDASYYSMMMSQNIPLRSYLNSKVGLMTVSVIVLGLLSIPYVYFGWHILLLNLACALYNLGVNIMVILLAGAYNKKRIDLEKSPFMNYQGTGATQWIVSLPLMIVPLLIWFIFYKLVNHETATLVLALLGIIGLVLRNWLLDKIAGIYLEKKYEAINGFKQQEN